MTHFTSIVTHNDFDGLGSAAMLSWAFDIEHIRFTGPIAVANAEIPISREDIVCDLPYPLECGMWFDHHAGNLGELKLRGIEVKTLPGRFAIAPSCVRVVYDYLQDTVAEDPPDDFAELANAADLIDSFAYPDLDAWRADTPANRIDRAIKAFDSDRKAHFAFLRDVTFLMRDLPLYDIAEDPDVKRRAEAYAQEELGMLELIRKYGSGLAEDSAGELFIVDTTSFINPVRLDKKLIGLVNPTAQCYVEMKPVFRGGRKTNDVSVSLSLSLLVQKQGLTRDVGEIVRVLNIGDGHAGAAAGVWRCESAHEAQKVKAELPRRILELWRRQKSN